MYYVISLAHTKKSDEFITLWRPKNAGYCYSKEMAGEYETVIEGYHNSDDNMAISTEVAETLFNYKVKNNDGEWRTQIRNNIDSWRKLGLKPTAHSLKRIKTKQ